MRKVVLYVLGMLLVGVAGTAVAAVSTVQSLRFWNETDHTRLVFDLSEKTAYHIFLLDNPRRIVVDLHDTRLAARIKQPEKSIPTFERVRYARRNQNDLRVVLDLKKDVRPESFVLRPQKQYGHRLVLDLYDSAVSVAAQNNRSQEEPHPREVKAPLVPRVVEAQPQQTLAKVVPSEAISPPVFSEQKSSKPAPLPTETRETPSKARIGKPLKSTREFVVAIDAGHGGNDPGAKGVRGTVEKNVVLRIAKKLEHLVAREAGMRAVLVRNGDYYLALRKRMHIARAAGADIFISIHADAFRQSNIRGSSVYTLSQQGASSEAARWLAAKENAADLVGGVSLGDKEDMVAEVLLDLSQTATMDHSTDLAEKVLRNLRQLGKVHKRRVQSAGFAVLKSPDVPSILVETAFISNPAEETNLNSGAYQDKLARAILNGIREYYRSRAATGIHTASRMHRIESGETLSGIAEMYGLSIRQLRNANTLRTTQIKAGQTLEIPTGS